jgi:predicted DCC family thiol-disulfide oxidoreductase YuxK
MNEIADPHIVVLFDGVCNLCSGVVQFLIPKDPNNWLRFASLQSPAGEHLRRAYGIDESVDSIVTIRNGRALTHTDGVIAIGQALGGPLGWLAAVVKFVPRPIRDAVYRLVAKNRYRMFGKKDHCWLPTPALRARFLPDG